MNPEEANRFGLSKSLLSLNFAMRYGGGIPVTSVWEGDHEVGVVIKDAHHNNQTIDDFKNIRVTGLLPTVTSTPLSQVATVSLLDARTISVQPWEKPMAAKVEKAIRESDLGLNPANMGGLIRVPMPPMSEERRREMTRLVRAEGENAKVAVRNQRRDANEAIKKLVKDKEATEDEQKRAEADIQKLTDRHVAEIDRMVAEKEKEVMEV